MNLYNKCSAKICKTVTTTYSTSFSYATSLLEKEHRDAIYSIYGFVRLADEIVDTFHEFDKNYLLNKFEEDFKDAMDNGISLNPVLNSFQITVKKYNISGSYVDAFLTSMKCDLEKKTYKTKLEADNYIYGSADVVGLMCLKVFCNGDDEKFNKLLHPAMKLGSAFQKVNFLRDYKEDTETLGRNYFPAIKNGTLGKIEKQLIIQEIDGDFDEAFKGIKQLPGRSKLAVLLAYYYYRILLNELKRTPASKICKKRIRITNFRKLLIMLKAKTLYNLHLI